jgi:hypothetical protein
LLDTTTSPPRRPAAREAQARRLRVTALEDDHDMGAVFAELLAEDAIVSVVQNAESLTPVADTSPDAIVLGLTAARRFGRWELVRLIRQHRTLHDVPIVLTTLNVADELRSGELSRYRDVHVVEVPCDGTSIRDAVRCFRSAQSTRSANRLPAVCSHGFLTDWVGECMTCATPASPRAETH